MNIEKTHRGLPVSANGPVRPRASATAVRLGVLALVLFLSACAATQPATESSDPFPERAQARWDALLAGDLETAYSFLSPGYRSTVSMIDWGVSERTRRVRWSSAEYVEHSCEESRCQVVFLAGFTVTQPVPGMDEFKGSRRVEETWLKIDGEWWYLPKK